MKGCADASLKKCRRPITFKLEYIEQARKLCAFGLTDLEIDAVYGSASTPWAFPGSKMRP
jgi:hypothetical protein